MSNETKWTPGPWFACHPDDLGETVARLDKIWAVKCNVPVASGKDDAHLIAAAPDLAEIVGHVAIDGAEITPELIDAARAAFAKARGETQ